MTLDELVDELVKGGYLKTPTLIDAFKSVDRKLFVPAEHKDEAYENKPLPIGFDQTISQPLTVAFMLELLQAQPGDKILDIGAGSGWQSALLSYIVGETGKVVGMERIAELRNSAVDNLMNLPELDSRVAMMIGDGSVGYAPEAPYDRIIAAAMSEEIPTEWKDQLKIGGTLVAPVGQSIVVMRKVTPEKFETNSYLGFSFVPLIKEN
jgi:protein-L-isoaspartate(D-aspartate) O-methyltransferase